MDAVLTLRREPAFHMYVWNLWAKVPNLLWLGVIAVDFWVTYLASTVH